MTDQGPDSASATPLNDTPDASVDDSAQDTALADALAVPELPEPTRRGLVTTAVDAAASSDEGVEGDDGEVGRGAGRLAAVLGVAAALVVGAVIGATIVTQPDDATPTAARAPATTLADGGPAAASPDGAGATDAGEAEAPAVPLVDLGDLGLISGADDVRSAVADGLSTAGPDATATPDSTRCSPGAGNASIYGFARFTASGTATREGSAVVVLVGVTPAGESVAVVLDPERGCEILETVPL